MAVGLSRAFGIAPPAHAEFVAFWFSDSRHPTRQLAGEAMAFPVTFWRKRLKFIAFRAKSGISK
jgi:hypothetical protein